MSRHDDHVALPELLARLGATHEIEPLRSRTAEMLIARPRPGVDGRTLLVKHCEARHVRSAEAAYDAFVRCDDVGRSDTRLVPTPECWGADPPYICTEYVASRPGSKVLKQLLSTDAETDTREALEFVERMGAILARFHRALPLSAAAQQQARRGPKLHGIARSLVGSPRGLGTPRVHLHTDFGLYNLIITETDEMLIVDLPGSDRVGVPEEDLGRLVADISLRVPATSPLRAALVDAALIGYESESELPVRSGAGRALVESFAARHALLMVIDGVRHLSRRRIRRGVRSIAASRRRVTANR